MNKTEINALHGDSMYTSDGVKAALKALWILPLVAVLVMFFQLLQEAGVEFRKRSLVYYIFTLVPWQVYFVAWQALILLIYNSVRRQMSGMYQTLSTQWTAMLALCGGEIVTDVLSTLFESDSLETLSSWLGLAGALCMAWLGRSIGQSYSGRMAKAGEAFLICGTAMVVLNFQMGIWGLDEYAVMLYGVEDSIKRFVVVSLVIVALSIWPAYICLKMISDGIKLNWLKAGDLPEGYGSPAGQPHEESAAIPPRQFQAQPQPVAEIQAPAANGEEPVKKESSGKKKIIGLSVVGLLIVAGLSVFVYGKISTKSTGSFESLPDETASVVSDVETVSTSAPSGDVAGKVVLAGGREYILLKNGRLGPVGYQGDGSWEKVGGAVVIFTGEGTSHISIIDGYVYEGRYKDGECWNEEWNPEEECLEDVGYFPTHDRGEAIVSLKWYD